jgi:MFS family permease
VIPEEGLQAGSASGPGRRLAGYFSRIGRLSGNARLFLLGTLLMGFGQGALWVHMNLYYRALGLGEEMIGRILSAGSFGTVVIALPAALWIDRVPAERVFALAAGGFGLILTLLLLVHDSHLLVLLSFASGMLFTIHWIAAAPFFMRNAEAENRIYLFGFANATETLAGLGAAVGVGTLARFLQSRTGSELLGLRWTLLGVAALSFLAVFPFARIRDRGASADRKKLRAYVMTRNWRLLWKLAFPGLLIGLGAGLIIPFLNLYFRDRFGQDVRQIGGYFGVSQVLTMAGFLVGAPLARRIGSVRAIVLTEALSIPFFLILAVTQSLPLAVLAFWARGALMNMNAPISNNFAMEAVGPDEQTATNSIRMLSWNAAWMVSTQIGGWLIQRRGFALPMVITICLYAVSAGIFFKFFRHHADLMVADTAPTPGESI